MKFAEKLDTLLNRLECSNINLSKVTNVDPSLISRFRTGTRVPAKNSKILKDLASGIVTIAKSTNNTYIIQELCITTAYSPEDLSFSVYKWFLKEDSLLRPERKSGQSHEQDLSKEDLYIYDFSEKLDYIMNSANISNVKLARAINVDASLISRLRTGVRTPSSESKIISDICEFIATRPNISEIAETFFDFIDTDEEKNSESYSQTIYEQLFAWFSQRKESDDSTIMDIFLDKLDSFHTDWDKYNEFPAALINANKMDRREVKSYWGNNGLKQVLNRFLSTVVSAETPRTLYLYSSQSIDWLQDDGNFTKTWKTLMLSILSKNNRICIIHHIDRSITEMLVGIEKWLPLYMTGMIIPYYCPDDTESKFKRTMFIAPELCYIASTSLEGAEDKAEHILSNDLNSVNNYMDQFNIFLSMCTPLTNFFSRQNSDIYSDMIGSWIEKGEETIFIGSSFSIRSMPYYLLDSILKRANVSKESYDKVMYYHSKLSHNFHKILEHFSYREIIAYTDKEKIRNGEIKLNIPEILLDEPVYYTHAEYNAHVAHIIDLIKNFRRYEIDLLPVEPFLNIEITLIKDIGVCVAKNHPPAVAFLFDHPMMQSAFDAYSVNILKKSVVNSLDRVSIIEFLKMLAT